MAKDNPKPKRSWVNTLLTATAVAIIMFTVAVVLAGILTNAGTGF
jgi:hypothetical protein